MMEEKEIIQGCINNDRKCQNALYKLYFPMMSSIALRYNKNKDDALLDINYGFYKVLINLSKYNPEYALATFIRNILIRHIIDELRKKKKVVFDSIENLNEIEIKYHDSNLAIENMNLEFLMSLLNQLPESSKTVFTLHVVDGYNHKEIADMLKISEGTSKWHLNNARTKMMEKLKGIENKEKMALIKSK